MSKQSLLPLGQEGRQEVLKSDRVTHDAANVQLPCLLVLHLLNEARALVLSQQATAEVCCSLQEADLEWLEVLDCVEQCCKVGLIAKSFRLGVL